MTLLVDIALIAGKRRACASRPRDNDTHREIVTSTLPPAWPHELREWDLCRAACRRMRKGEHSARGKRMDGSWSWTLRDASGKVLRELASRNPTNGGTVGTASWSWVRDYVYRDGLLLASRQPGPNEHRESCALLAVTLVTAPYWSIIG